MVRIDREPAGQQPAVEALLDRVFGPGRHGKTAQRLRDGQSPAAGLSFVATSERRLIASLRFWDLLVGRGQQALLLGPLAVEPEAQGIGIGQALVRAGLAQAAALGHEAVLLVGDPAYYGRLGFSSRLTENLELPGPYERHRFQGLELRPGALAGARGLVRPFGLALAPALSLPATARQAIAA